MVPTRKDHHTMVYLKLGEIPKGHLEVKSPPAVTDVEYIIYIYVVCTRTNF